MGGGEGDDGSAAGGATEERCEGEEQHTKDEEDVLVEWPTKEVYEEINGADLSPEMVRQGRADSKPATVYSSSSLLIRIAMLVSCFPSSRVRNVYAKPECEDDMRPVRPTRWT